MKEKLHKMLKELNITLEDVEKMGGYSIGSLSRMMRKGRSFPRSLRLLVNFHIHIKRTK